MVVLALVACRTQTRGVAATSSVATSPPTTSSRPPTAPCPSAAVSAEQAQIDLSDAKESIARAGEHPTDQEFSAILSRLRRAAYAGNLAAQKRFGGYVVGYYYTDNLFWPDQPEIAIPALAMLRIAARRSPDPNDTLLVALARDPIAFTDPDGPPPLPKQWLDAALDEARKWENCAAAKLPQPREDR
jgi:hypothetical protein